MSYRNKVLEGRILRAGKIISGLGSEASTYLGIVTGSQGVIIEHYTVSSKLKEFTMALHEDESFAGVLSEPLNLNLLMQGVNGTPELLISVDATPDNAPLDPANSVFSRISFQELI